MELIGVLHVTMLAGMALAITWYLGELLHNIKMHTELLNSIYQTICDEVERTDPGDQT